MDGPFTRLSQSIGLDTAIGGIALAAELAALSVSEPCVSAGAAIWAADGATLCADWSASRNVVGVVAGRYSVRDGRGLAGWVGRLAASVAIEGAVVVIVLAS
jgi:hypothetical protein